jgi:glutathione S-transferase
MGASLYVCYGLRLSYFTRKLEAALQLYDVPFELRLKDMTVRAEVEKRSGTNQVPVLLTPEDEMIADTTPILGMLDQRLPGRRLFPTGPTGVLVHVIEEWFDEWLPRTALYYRWCFDDSRAYASAELAADSAPDAPDEVRQSVALMIADWGRRACRANGMLDEGQQQAAEERFVALLESMERQLSETRYLLGDRPTAADTSMLGGLRGHFLLDPAPKKVAERYKQVTAWSESATDWDGAGELPDFPETTAFGEFVLGDLAETYRPYLLANRAALTVGDKFFHADIYDQSTSFKVMPYKEASSRMIGRRIKERLQPEGREQVTGWLDDRGLTEMFGGS